MPELLQLFRRSRQPSAPTRSFLPVLRDLVRLSYPYSALGAKDEVPAKDGKKGTWLTLPPFDSDFDASVVGKEMIRGHLRKGNCDGIPPAAAASTTTTTTALKWVRRCCPGVPANLVQKLFRLRQVRRQVTRTTAANQEAHAQQFKRVSAKDAISKGDVILLPISVHQFSPVKDNYRCNNDEISYIRSLELYKDPAIIVVNKPHGLPVQGGIGIKLSIDVLASSSLRYDYQEAPRLVHRLDKDSSGVLVLGRTQTSTTILHSIFREKTFGASTDVGSAQRILQRKYWALVIGIPKRSRGTISAPLAKVVLENGKSERITIADVTSYSSSQVAITEYKVIGSSKYGYTWLELSPLTGRKHQIRVHCADALGTPIVGDLKYGWQAHKNWEPLLSAETFEDEELQNHNLPLGLSLEGGSVSDKKPRLHLHCREMILPNISSVLKDLQSSDSEYDFSKVESLNLVAPLPCHMQRSWHILHH